MPGQAPVGEDQVHVLGLEGLERLLAARHGHDLVALELERPLQRPQEDLVVLDEQEPSLHRISSWGLLAGASSAAARPRATRCGRGVPRPGALSTVDVAAVQIHDLLHDRHAEPGARGLGGEERLEDLVAVLGRDARCRYRSLRRWRGRAATKRLTSTRPPPPARLDGLQRVLDDVGEDLAQLLAVRRRDQRRGPAAP